MSNSASGYVVSDYSIMAIVTGLFEYGLATTSYDETICIDGKEITSTVELDMTEALKMTAESLRVVNEYQTVDTNTVQPKVKGEARDYPLVAHVPVKISHRRKFTDAERMQACNAWLAQVDNGKPMDFDFLTIMETVKQLVKKMTKANHESGEWTRRCFFGKYQYFVDGVNVSKEQLDLAA